MSESKTVRLDKELMDSLAEQREGFETPNDCLKRLLNGKKKPTAMSCTPAEVKATAEEVEDSES